jgi:aminoglycoside phosphotransferase (APT) family kinase protein
LLRPALGEVPVLSVHRVGGGLVNTNVRVELTGEPGRVLLRLYQREMQQAHKEAAIDKLVGGTVPTARFLYFAPDNPISRRPYAVLQWIYGAQLDQAARDADDTTLVALGHAVGEVLAGIHAFRFPRAGFFTTELEVPSAIDLDKQGLLRFMRQCLLDGPGGERLGGALTEQLFAFVEREGHRLDDWLDDPRLTHADCNPSNILVAREGTGWRIAAVLDWEFALSATPAFDFGNLLRPPFGSSPAFVKGLAGGYRAAGGRLPRDWPRIARLADLFSWADLLGQRSDDPVLAADARRIIAATIEGR